MTDFSAGRKKIAVVGAGVAGIVCAHYLQKAHDVALLEAADYLGGHTNTIILDEGPDAGTAIDTGFIVTNDRTYPHFKRFLKDLGVAVQASDMSFGFHCETTGLAYASRGLNSIFAQRGNLLRPRFLAMLADILRFNKSARNDLGTGNLANQTLADYLSRGGLGAAFQRNYLLPMAAAIWSCPPDQVGAFPAAAFLRFFENHGLLTVRHQPTWETVVGGSRRYVDAFLKGFGGEVLLKARVQSITRDAEGVAIRWSDRVRRFDAVVVAVHADIARKLLADPSPDEDRLLRPWQYQANVAILHCDASAMPANPRAWASWNYVREAGSDGNSTVSVTYDMNRLQRLNTQRRYFVSLNRRKSIDPRSVLRRIEYHHPVYTGDSLATHAELPQLNGVRNTYFCGSYHGYGFHEDAVRSAVAVAARFGLAP